MTAERVTAEAPPTHEMPLAGKKAFVIGGDRDVGGGIVLALAKHGVDVAFSYHDKADRARKMKEKTADMQGNVYGFPSEIYIGEGRSEAFNNALMVLGGDFDFLILSTSGSTPELNIHSSNHFLDMGLAHAEKEAPAFRKKKRLFRMNSVPGHFFRQLNGTTPLGRYQEIAGNKSPDIESLRERIPEMERLGITFVEICPPIVPDTGAAKA